VSFFPQIELKKGVAIGYALFLLEWLYKLVGNISERLARIEEHNAVKEGK